MLKHNLRNYHQKARIRVKRYNSIAKFGILLIGALLASAAAARAEVVRMQIDERAPFAEGRSFGRSGSYEKVSGRLFFELDPDSPANSRITDIQLAPRNERGKVEFWTDFFILKPTDPSRGNRRILYDVHNRGNKLAVWTFNGVRSNNPTSLADAGNGFLMRHGYTIVWSGWNGDVMPDGNDRLIAGLPIARENGQEIVGRIHAEICRNEKVFSQPIFHDQWSTSRVYPAVNVDNSTATLTMRPTRAEPAAEVPRDQWAFARLEDGKPIADPTHLHIKQGLKPGWLYELTYTAKNPRVTGLGFASIRDCVSFFRYSQEDARGVANPLGRSIEKAYIFGISQSGRVIHHFIHEGLNTNQNEQIVFDAALIHVAGAGKGVFNHRFGMTTLYGTYHQNNLAPSEFFPFTPMPQKDPITGQAGSTLDRARAKGQVPKMIFTQSSSEYWSRGGSLLHTDVEGRQDLKLDPNMRVYLIAGAQHLGGGEPTKGICQQPRNVLDDRGPVLRAMLVALDRWAGGLKEPPPSRYPRIADGTLVDLATFRKQFPKMPDISPPTAYYAPRRLDPGPRWFTQGIADNVPPKVGPAYRTLIPAVDADGNDLAGIRLPDVAVPLGTFAGWNLRAAEYGNPGILAGLNGMYLPLALTAKERHKLGDPRPSVLERYPTRDVYLALVAEAALKLNQEGFLLDADLVEILNRAAARKLWGEK